MKPTMQREPEPEKPRSSPLWDTLVRVALIRSLAWLCFTVFSPFLKLMVWSIILAVNLYPAHQWRPASSVNDKDWLRSFW